MMMIGLTLMAFGSGWETRTSTVELPNPNGSVYRYTVVMPENPQPDKRYPLVLALHYGGRVSPFFGKGFLEVLVGPAYGQGDWIIVAPDCPGRGWASQEAQDFIPKLLDHFKVRYPVNHQKVLVGFSMGASGVYYWSQAMPGAWSAAVALSGRPPSGDPDKLKQTPFTIIHSRDDGLISFTETMKAVKHLKKQGVTIKWVPLKGFKHYQTGAFGPSLKRTIPWVKKQLNE